MRKNTRAMELLRAAGKAMRNAYAPYSKYRVGAAILADDGTVFTGCNVENASYGLTVCAERNAAAAAVAAGRKRIRAVAIVADGKDVPRPCGACLQVLGEFCGRDVPVFSARAGGLASFNKATISDLLPKRFDFQR